MFLKKGLLFDGNEDIVNPIKSSTFKNNSNFVLGNNQKNKTNNENNLISNNKNSIPISIPKELPKKKNIWDEEDFEDL